MADTSRVDVKNITDGPKIFNGLPVQMIPAGQSYHDIEVSDAELQSMRASEWFEITGGAGVEPSLLDGSVDDLTTHLASITDADEVQKLIDGEVAGKSRKSALAALEARRDELLA